MYGIISSLVLFLAAITKLVSTVQHGTASTSLDPLLGISNQKIFLFAITSELILVGYGLGGRFSDFWVNIIVTLFGTFTAYHMLNIVFVGTSSSCLCFGDSLLGLASQNPSVHFAVPVVTAVMGVWGFRIVHSKQRAAISQNSSLKRPTPQSSQIILILIILLSCLLDAGAAVQRLPVLNQIVSMTGVVERVVYLHESNATNRFAVNTGKFDDPTRLILQIIPLDTQEFKREEIQWNGQDIVTILQQRQQKKDGSNSNAATNLKAYVYADSFPRQANTPTQLAWLALIIANQFDKYTQQPVFQSLHGLYRETNLTHHWSDARNELVISNTGPIYVRNRQITTINDRSVANKVIEIAYKALGENRDVEAITLEAQFFNVETDSANQLTNRASGHYRITLNTIAKKQNSVKPTMAFFDLDNIDAKISFLDYRFSRELSDKAEFSGSGLAYVLAAGIYPDRNLKLIADLKVKTTNDLSRIGKYRNILISILIAFSVTLYLIMRKISSGEQSKQQPTKEPSS